MYRTLELLVRLEIVHKNSFDERKYRYEFGENDGHFHHHFLCSNCGVIIEVEEDYLSFLEEELERRGFYISDHNLQIYGLCPDCRRGTLREKGQDVINLPQGRHNLGRLVNLGIGSGVELEVMTAHPFRGPIVVRTDDKPVGIGHGPAKRMMVEEY